MPNEFTTLSPLDGRYREETKELQDYFSEYALFKYRLLVEIRYLEALSKAGLIRRFSPYEKREIDSILTSFVPATLEKIGEKEKETKEFAGAKLRRQSHDIKALEYYLKEQLKGSSLEDVSEMVHFGLTSYDVNELAYGLMLKGSLKEVYLPHLSRLIFETVKLAKAYKSTPMLARTHGQPAAPTTFGKEMMVFAKRLADEYDHLGTLEVKGKLTGAVGNFNSLAASYPRFDWLDFSINFVKTLDLAPEFVTTQILPQDSLARIFDSIRRINTILIGLNQDLWWYMSLGYLKQKIGEAGGVGSSAMPHKVNPTDFENAEGNLGLANALLDFFRGKLLISRLQRDLSDSTVRRNFGLAFGYSLLGIKSTQSGLERIEADKERMTSDLGNHWEILSEGIQTILKTTGYQDAYEEVARFARGRRVTQKDWQKFFTTLKVDKKTYQKLISLTPLNYLGYAEKIVDRALSTLKGYVKEKP